MSFLDDWKEWSSAKKAVSIIAVCCIGLLVIGVIGGMVSPDKNTSTTTNTNENNNNSNNGNTDSAQVYKEGTYKVGSDILQVSINLHKPAHLEDMSNVLLIHQWNLIVSLVMRLQVKKDQQYM